MASLWETDPIQISALANAQYSSVGGGTSTWKYIFPSFSTASDGDIHVNMGFAATGNTGSMSGNQSESPIVPEVINATSAQLTTIDSLSKSQALVCGIFRWYSEHTGERKYEIHPATQLLKWNGSAFVMADDYHQNIRLDKGSYTGDFYPNSTYLTTEFDGSDVVTAAVIAANSDLIRFTYPSPRFNYCQYRGYTLSGLTNDSVSSFFWLRPDLVPNTAIRCRIVTNTGAAAAAALLVSNQLFWVNGLTRCDLLVVSNKIAGMTFGQTNVFTWPVELITLSVFSNAPPKVLSVTPSCGSTNGGRTINIYGSNFVSGVSVMLGGVPAGNIVVNISTNITVVTPPGSTGAKIIAVTDPYNQTGTLTSGFTYSAPPSFAGLANATAAIEAATLTWAAASGTGVTYNVYEGTASNAENFASAVTNTSALSALITGLYPGSNSPLTYFFVVRASDTCGSGESNAVEKSIQPLLDPTKDQDSDGMLNGYEQQYSLAPFNASDASADPDGDGFTNLQEFQAGTDPTNSASAFRITSIVQDGTTNRVTWSTATGKTNAVQRTAGDSDGSYVTNSFSDIFTVTNTIGSVTNYPDPDAATNFPSLYYRIRLVP